MKNTVVEMNVFAVCFYQQSTAEERIGEPEHMSIETSQTEMQRENNHNHNHTDH